MAHRFHVITFVYTPGTLQGRGKWFIGGGGNMGEFLEIVTIYKIYLPGDIYKLESKETNDYES